MLYNYTGQYSALYYIAKNIYVQNYTGEKRRNFTKNTQEISKRNLAKNASLIKILNLLNYFSGNFKQYFRFSEKVV